MFASINPGISVVETTINLVTKLEVKLTWLRVCLMASGRRESISGSVSGAFCRSSRSRRRHSVCRDGSEETKHKLNSIFANNRLIINKIKFILKISFSYCNIEKENMFTSHTCILQTLLTWYFILIYS